MTLAGRALAGGVTFYGLELGAPLSLPPCVSIKAVDRKADYKGPCRIDGKSGTATVMWMSTPGPTHSPKGLDFLDVKLIDGRIERIEQTTAGLAVQEAVFTDLTAKFGTPTHFKKRPFGNVYGQRYEGIEAGWSVDDAIVLFFGLENSVDHGRIEVATRRDLDSRERLMRTEKGRRPKM